MKAFTPAFLLALFGCTETTPDPAADAIPRMIGFRDEMCGCQNKPCADEVQERMTKWSSEMAVRLEDRPAPKASVEEMKKMTEVGQAYGECMTRAMSAAAMEPPAPPPPPPRKEAPPPDALPPASTLDAARLLQQAREWALDARPQHHIKRVQFAYVDANGFLDPTYGNIDVEFGRLDETKVKRRIGTPVPPRKKYEDCFAMIIKGGRWEKRTIECNDTIDYVPRCSVQTIWKRAIARRVPADAVALVTFDVPTKTWELALDDMPLDIHHHETFADDCPIEVERPTKSDQR